MADTTLVVIGIQARSTSTRLPNKIHLEIDSRALLQHVIDNCTAAANYINRHYSSYGTAVKVCVVCPEGDALVEKYKNHVQIYQGSENDVLSRYVSMCVAEKADYVVRVTADCVFLPSFMISRCIKSAVLKECDYTSNVLVRTFMEGMDCEVLSARLLTWLDKNATDAADREHVTIYLAKNKFPFRKDGQNSLCHILDCYDRSSEKTSIDTFEEYQKALQKFAILKRKKLEAKKTGFWEL